MNIINSIATLMIRHAKNGKISKKRLDLLLGAVALGALSKQAAAAQDDTGGNSYKIDLVKLAKEAGLDISEIDNLLLSLADKSAGQLVFLGDGIYLFFPAVAGEQVDLLILGAEQGAIPISLSLNEVSGVIAESDSSDSFLSSFDLNPYLSKFLHLASVDKTDHQGDEKSDVADADVKEGSAEAGVAINVTVDVDMAGLGLAILAVAAAGGGGGGGTVLSSLSGVISHGTLQNAQVFLDVDGDGALGWTDSDGDDLWDSGEGEQWTLSDADGVYSLTGLSAADISNGTLVGQAYKVNGVSQTTDTISGSDVENIVMKADAASASVITPLTTLVEAGVSNEDVLEILGLDATSIEDVNSYNPFSDENEGSADSVAFEKVASQIFTTVNAIAEAVSAAAKSDKDADDIFTIAIGELVEDIQEEKQVRDDLQVIIDAGGAGAAQAESDLVARNDIDLTDSNIVEDIVTATIAEVDAQIATETGGETTSKIDDAVSDLTTSISNVVAKINNKIDEVEVFDSTAGDTLNVAAEFVADQVSSVVNRDIPEAALVSLSNSLDTDLFIATNEDASTADRTFAVTGTTAAGSVDADGIYGNLVHSGSGDSWVYELNNDAQELNDGETYSESFVISEGGANHTVTIMVLGKNDAPVITSSATIDMPENVTRVGTVVATDVDSDDSITYALSGTDASLFSISSAGVLTFNNAPDFEGVDPAHGVPHSNEYSITVTANDGTDTVDQAMTITVTNVEGGPEFGSSSTPAVDENQTSVVTLAASDDENDNIEFSITGGVDAGSFNLTNGVLTFKTAPDFETKSSYSLTVTASETTNQAGDTIASPNTTDQEITVTINDVNDAAVVAGTSTGAVTEDSATTTAQGTLTHTDVDTNNADNTFTVVATPDFSDNKYGYYTVAADGAWTYTLDNTDSTVSALAEAVELEDTFTITAEDGTPQVVTITITGANDAAVIAAEAGTVAEGNTVIEAENVISSENVFQINSAQVILNDFDPNTDSEIHRIVDLTSSGSAISVDGATTLNLSNLTNAANNSGEFLAPTLSFELVKVPTGSGSGTIGIDITDGSDATRDNGTERQVHIDIAVDWSADGTDAQITVPTQTVGGHYLTAAGSRVDFTLNNLAADTITVTENGLNYPATIDLKFASIIDGLESVGSVSLLEEGNYYLAVATDLPISDSSGTSITSISSAVEITDDMSVDIGITPTSNNVFQINSAQVILNDFDPNTDSEIHRIVDLTSSGSAISVDGATTLNLSNLTNAANNSGEFLAPTLSFELVKVPTGSGSGTIGIDITDGSDATRDNGTERQVHIDIAVDWSADGTDAQITVPTQTVGGHYLTAAGSRVDFTLNNLAADTITVTENGLNYPATIDLKFASIIDGLESVGSVSLLEEGNYYLAVTTDLPIADSSGTSITSISSAVEITDDMSVDIGATGTTIESTTVSGTAFSTDVDTNNADNTFTAVTAGTASTNGYGTYEVTTGGAWTYTLNNNLSAVNVLGVGQSLTDTITVTTEDLTAQNITININGTNDAAVIVGTSTGVVTEDSATTTAQGTLTHTDVDNNNADNTFTIVAAGTASTGGYGTYEVTTGGAWTYTLDNDNISVDALGAGAQLTDTITVTAEDGTTEAVDITITGTNDAAVITAADGAITEGGTTVSDTATHTDVDSNNSDNVFTAVAAGTASTGGYGTYEVTTGGAWTYTLDNDNISVDALGAGAQLTDTITVTAEDGTTEAVDITITGTNDAAVITAADGAITEGGTTVSDTATHADVDSNNSDNVFTAVTNVATTYGTYTVDSAGAWTYTLDNGNVSVDALGAGAQLTDTITITAEDNTTETVDIVITGANDAAVITAADGAITEGGTTVSDTATHADVDSNNSDNVFNAVTNVATTYGTYTVDSAGAWTYTLDNGNVSVDALGAGAQLTDTITITAEDNTTETVDIVITGANDAAVITAADGAITEGGTTVSDTATHADVDSNNSDNVFNAVAAGTASTGGYGTYEVTTGGAWTYTLDNDNISVDALGAGAQLTDTITITAEDGTTEDVDVVITGVNDTPVITSSTTVNAPENDVVVTTVTATDAESQDITFAIEAGGDADLFTMTTDGVLTFRAAPDYELVDPVAADNTYTLTVSATDTSLAKVTQEITVTVTNVEGAPVFSSASAVTVDENQTALVTLTASDDENDQVAFTITGGADQGAFNISNGVLTFKQAPDFETQPSYALTVTATESATQSGDPITSPNSTEQNIAVTITDINDAAVIMAADGAIAEGVATVGDTATHTDADTGNDDNTFQAVTAGTASTNGYGTYAVTTAGAWTYTLNSSHVDVDALGAGVELTDTITVTAEDGTTEAVDITITGTNDAAVIAGTSTGAVTEDHATTTATGTLTHTDVDADNNDNTFTAVTTATDSANGYGTYTVTSGGAWVYTMNNSHVDVDALGTDDELIDTITVTAEDGTEQTVTVTITGANDQPVAVADSVEISEDAAATIIDVLGNDTDAEDTIPTVNGKISASHGIVILTDGVITYQPDPDYNGSDSFQYTVIDSESLVSELGTVNITVTPDNDPPTGAVTISGTTKTGQTLTAVTDTLADVDGLGALSYQWAKGGVNISGETSSTLVLDDTDIGSTFTVTASYTDGDGAAESVASSATAAVTDIVKLIQVRDAATLTAADASVEINGSDFTGASTDTVLKFDLYFDAEGLDSLNANATEVRGAEFTIAWDETQLDSVSAFASDEIAAWLMDLDFEASVFDVATSNNIEGSVALGNATAIVDIDPSNDADRNPVLLEQKIGTVYINPKDGETDIQLTIQGMTISTDDADVIPLNYVVDVL